MRNKEDLKVGFQFDGFEIIEKLPYYIRKANKLKTDNLQCLYKCKCLQCGKFFNLKEDDILNKDFTEKCGHSLKGNIPINEKDLGYIGKQIDEIFIKDVIRIYRWTKDKLLGHTYVIIDCSCGIKDLAIGLKDIIIRKNKGNKISCGHLTLEKMKEEKEFVTGEVINQWELKEKIDNKWVLCKCKCCGEERKIQRNQLSSTLCKKRAKEKRQFIKEMKSKLLVSKLPEKTPNLIGYQSGRLTVIDFSFYINNGSTQSDRFWLCECSCIDKNKVVVNEIELLHKTCMSCGCLNREVGLKNRKYDDSYIGKIYNSLKIKEIKREKINGTHMTFFICECLECHKIVMPHANDVIKGHVQSCGCVNSKGERKIFDFLQSINLHFETQKTFDGCKNKKLLRFDFLISNNNDSNKFVLIEFQGNQHYNPSSFTGKKDEKEMKEKLEYTQKNDQIKRDYCKAKNIPLLEIPYWKMDKIEEIIIKFLKENFIVDDDFELSKEKDITEGVEMDLPLNTDINKISPVSFKGEINDSPKKDTFFNKYMKRKVEESKLKESKLQCNHDPNSSTTTLVKTSKRTLVFPPQQSFFCSTCGQGFSFIMVDGKYEESNN